MGRALFFAAAPKSGEQAMDEFKVFKNFKERGEWVELRFMAEARATATKSSSPGEILCPSTLPSTSALAS